VISPKHDDYPALLAEALDFVAGYQMDPAHAARVLGCTASQIIKLIKTQPKALEWVNQCRRQAGLHPLH